MADKIKQLPPQVADQISAGEVIERPASVVKELVENSLDAESDSIFIEIKKGGKEKIRVQDNGQGIKGDQLELAFCRYATSKIGNVNDIYSLRTLGFRGEALASIASVSRVEAISRHKNENKGSKIIIKGSEIQKKEPAPAAVGTDITVTDLFYNTPARYKYMKTTNTELGHISTAVCNEALAYPGVKFTLEHNDKQVVQTPGSGKLKDAILAIYGRELVNNLLPVDFEDQFIQVQGYVARPDFNRSSRVYEKFFVNNRTIRNTALSRGVERAYGGLIPGNKYPIVFLNIKLNPILVDVNVHPSKKEVKFSRNQVIQNVLKKGIKKTISEIDASSKMKLNKKNVSGKKEEKTQKIDFTEQSSSGQQKTTKKTGPKKDNYSSAEYNKEKGAVRENKADYKFEQHNSQKKKKKTSSQATNQQVSDEEMSELPFRKILGQVEETYLVVEGKDGLYIVDQHAAEERIIYEKLNKKYNNSEVSSQALLVPVNLELTPGEIEILNKYKSELEELGFKIDSFGGQSVIIQEVPALIKKRSHKEVVREIIDNLLQKGEALSPAEMIEEIITYMSCRMAVKAGENLQPVLQKQIVKDLFATENPYRCPHGRPAILHLDSKELKKGLGRI
ncbi:MAG: DNA mismatch repair endonuclease MutL [Halanaerobiaceae bacterium]